MISLNLLVAHFVGDFLLQSNWMAVGKSKHLLPLTIHCLVYSSCFLFWGWAFALAVFLGHFIVDAITSKITSALWFIRPDGTMDDAKRHWFFVAIGADQLIHYIVLHATWNLMFHTL